MKRVSMSELKKRGYLQEVNRLFFHPLGMALAVREDGETVSFAGILDSRDDPEGYVFDDVSEELAAAIGREWEKRARRRVAALGFVQQPVGPYDPHPHHEPPPGPPLSVLRRRPFSRR